MFPGQKLHVYLKETFTLFTVFYQIQRFKYVVTWSHKEVHSRNHCCRRKQ